MKQTELSCLCPFENERDGNFILGFLYTCISKTTKLEEGYPGPSIPGPGTPRPTGIIFYSRKIECLSVSSFFPPSVFYSHFSINLLGEALKKGATYL